MSGSTPKQTPLEQQMSCQNSQASSCFHDISLPARCQAPNPTGYVLRAEPIRGVGCIIWRSMMQSAGEGLTPEWVLALQGQGQGRRLEMTGPNAVIRFSPSPRNR